MLLEFGKASRINKARQQPEKVRMIMKKLQTDGLLTTFDALKTKIDEPISLGYCNAGRVIEDTEGCANVNKVASNIFRAGERVVTNGPHAEMVSVPQQLMRTYPRFRQR